MVKTTLPTFPAVLKQLVALGERMRLARLRRKITAELFSERMGVSRETLRRLENGDPTIAMGTYMRALRVLGLDGDIDALARDDELGRKLQDLALPQPQKRKRTPK
jgi:transcriptional regulator with XRE-family HTH domain